MDLEWRKKYLKTTLAIIITIVFTTVIIPYRKCTSMTKNLASYLRRQNPNLTYEIIVHVSVASVTILVPTEKGDTSCITAVAMLNLLVFATKKPSIPF